MVLSKMKKKYLEPKISIIVPVYNAEKSIKKCLMSILVTKSPFEIICVNDGSSDKSLSILRKIQRKYKCNYR